MSTGNREQEVKQIDAICQAGITMLEAGQVDLALATLDRAVSFGIPRENVHRARAAALAASGRYDEALVALQEELTVRPSHAETFRFFIGVSASLPAVAALGPRSYLREILTTLDGLVEELCGSDVNTSTKVGLGRMAIGLRALISQGAALEAIFADMDMPASRARLVELFVVALLSPCKPEIWAQLAKTSPGTFAPKSGPNQVTLSEICKRLGIAASATGGGVQVNMAVLPQVG